MKNPTLATFGLVMAMALSMGLRGFSPSPAGTTVTPTQFPGGIPSNTPGTATLNATLSSTPGTSTSTATRRPTLTPTLMATATPTPIFTASAVPTLLLTPTVTLTLEAQSPLTNGVSISALNSPAVPRYVLALNPQALAVDSLRARPYGGGVIKITRVVSSDDIFKRVLFEYPSEGLRITGMMNIPQGVGPFPVVILDHGYFKPSEFKTGDGTIRAADNFARHGYLTLASDYRCYGGSQCSSNPLDIGYAIDVLNLIADLPSLPFADTAHVGIWGHSMGGAVTIRVLAVSDQIKVGALYGAVTGDDEVHYCWLNGCRPPAAPTPDPRLWRVMDVDPDFMQGLPTPVLTAPDPLARLREIFQKSSPTRYVKYINAPVIIHHGEADDVVPIQWSVDLADSLSAQGKLASLFTYPGEGHVFAGWNWDLFMARTLSFFNPYLNPRGGPLTVEQRVLRQERGISELSY